MLTLYDWRIERVQGGREYFLVVVLGDGQDGISYPLGAQNNDEAKAESQEILDDLRTVAAEDYTIGATIIEVSAPRR